MTELHYAAYRNDPQAVEIELQSGADVDVRDDAGWTPMHWSIDMSQAWGEPEQVVSRLLAAGASTNAVDSSGYSVLMMACSRNNEAILEQLIQAGADIRARNADTTPLHEAASCNFSKAIRKLLLLGADPSERNAHGQTAEEIAADNEFESSVEAFKSAEGKH